MVVASACGFDNHLCCSLLIGRWWLHLSQRRGGGGGRPLCLCKGGKMSWSLVLQGSSGPGMDQYYDAFIVWGGCAYGWWSFEMDEEILLGNHTSRWSFYGRRINFILFGNWVLQRQHQWCSKSLLAGDWVSSGSTVVRGLALFTHWPLEVGVGDACFFNDAMFSNSLRCNFLTVFKKIAIHRANYAY